MSENITGEDHPEKEITLEELDINDAEQVGRWIKQVAIRVPRGHEDMTNPQTGQHLTRGEQLEAFIQNTVDVLNFIRDSKKAPPDELKSTLNHIVEPLTKPDLVADKQK